MLATKPISRLFSALLVTVSMLTFPVGQAVAHQNPEITAQSEPVRGVRDDLWADIVLGKPDFGETGPYEVTGSRVFNPGGVIIDRSVTPNRMYIYDGGNSRVLGIHVSVNAQSGRRAELVLGQPGLDGYAGCNRDGNFQNYPQRAPASAATLCTMPENQVSPGEGGSFANMAVDANGNLYVPDFDNHRVLFYTSPFETDTIADDVWGQTNFSDNECNHNNGIDHPDTSSLCLRSFYNEGFVGGVGVDNANNLWVADNQNNRVLRFPYDSGTGRAGHVADLVLGQANFTSGAHASGMNRMFAPAAVRVNAAGKVYVADSLNDRILIFNPPFSNGMAASNTLGSNLRSPTSIEFDLSGNTWVSDSMNNQLLRFTPAGVVDRVLFKDKPTYNGDCGGSYTSDGPKFYFPGPNVYQDSANLCDSRGSIGIDSNGNIWVSGSNFLQDVRRYPAPFPVPNTGVAHSADVQLFQSYAPNQQNAVSGRGLSSPRGMAVGANQLIVSDGGRLLFWNNAPDSLTSGKAADGVVMAPNFNISIDPPIGLVRADGHNRLWVLRGNEINVYHLPLVTGATPFYTLDPPLAVRESITWNPNLAGAGMVVSSDGNYLWLSDPDSSRVIRIASPLTNPVVDVILGQVNASDNQCNQGRGQAQPSADSLCYPSGLAMDANGNIFVSDFALEDHGNYRLLEYDASLFPTSPDHAIFGVPASRVYGTSGSFTTPGCQNQNLDPLCRRLEPVFNRAGQMIIGLSGYAGQHFPLVYQNPLTNLLPTDTLKDYYSMPSATYYDEMDNLYVADRNRGRVLVYLTNTNTISGNAGIAGATLSYTDGIPKTATANDQGEYWLRVSNNWSGVVTPSKPGATFTPANRSYTNVTANQTGQSYTATSPTYTISGNTGVAGATLKYTDGTLKTAIANGSGDYSFTVSYGWSGIVIPSKAGLTFTPLNRSYANVLTNKMGQDYVVTAVFMSDATLDGWVLESGENSKTGGSRNNVAATLNLGDDAARRQYLGILSFNTGASLPDNAVITAVTLRVKKSAEIGDVNLIAKYQGFLVDIRKGFLGLAPLQTSDFQSAANKSYGPFTPELVNNWYAINLTNAKDYINKLPANSGLTQIRLRFKLDDNNNKIANYLRLYSGNAPAANRPQLVITYRMP